MWGPLCEGPRLRAHKRAPRLDPDLRPVRRRARRTYRGLRVECHALADEPRRRRKRGRHEGAHAGGGGRSDGAAFVSRALAFRVVPVVPRGRPSSGQTDEPDGGGRVPRAARLVVSIGAVLSGPALPWV